MTNEDNDFLHRFSINKCWGFSRSHVALMAASGGLFGILFCVFVEFSCNNYSLE